MLQLTRAVLESEVLEKIAEEILDQIKNYVREKESGIVFWGVNKERPGFCFMSDIRGFFCWVIRTVSDGY